MVRPVGGRPRVTTPLQREPLCLLQGEMSSPEPGTSTASTSQEPRDGSGENPACPACQDIDTKCSSLCWHCFCGFCLGDWNLSDAACPQCQRPIRHTYPQHVALYHEVQDQVYDSKQRRLGHPEQGASSCSRRSGSSHDETPEQGRRRSLRWHRDGHQWSRHAQGSSSLRRRRRQRRRRRHQWRRDRDNVPAEGRAPGSEQDTSGSSWGRRFRRRSHMPRSQDQQERARGRRSRQTWQRRNREHSRRWNRQWSRSRRQRRNTQTSSSGMEPHDDSARQRRWRSRNAGEQRAPRHQQDIPDS
ncbi:uncharacterized protein DDB_G0287625-like isoform X2 [Neopelma chrysocephalum]|uniref:uncharacterized protein DDB_G0287625-like isoform X2 n=1 Tax=Neopelma chrysocephalum TaxID=114329 RepID=UPI000FCD396F|nr:uncharacterized protein DDB_G0287625-like isoform X2 [Neopelma chrysocephalum]